LDAKGAILQGKQGLPPHYSNFVRTLFSNFARTTTFIANKLALVRGAKKLF
jgi:hypothetical protein